jgi:hypothetical protein
MKKWHKSRKEEELGEKLLSLTVKIVLGASLFCEFMLYVLKNDQKLMESP